MLTGREALEKTDWSRLNHAYGRATDTPEILRGLLTNDPLAHKKAIDHLSSAIIHQGTPWTATGPVALVLAGLLFEESVIHEVNDGDPEENLLALRADLAGFLADCAGIQDGETALDLETLEKYTAYNIDEIIDSGDDDKLFEGGEASDAFFARSVLSCVKAAPVLMETACARLNDPDPRMRACAAMAAARLCAAGPLAHRREEIKDCILNMARAAQDSTERSALVLTLNVLDFNPVEFLNDESNAVQICAALADCFRHEKPATDVLLKAINDHAASIDTWFEWHPPQLRTRPRFTLLRRLLYDKPIVKFERVAQGAVELARITLRHFVDYEWGPLLQSAFPEHDGKVKSDVQREFLNALVENAQLWDSRDQTPLMWFKKAGLPYDRKLCKRRVEGR